MKIVPRPQQEKSAEELERERQEEERKVENAKRLLRYTSKTKT